jgi:hypothetical protein
MPELKNSFTKGKMNKDLDERIIPSNEYREALNIGVATSEDSDVGAAQNILGNVLASCAIQGPLLPAEETGGGCEGAEEATLEINNQIDELNSAYENEEMSLTAYKTEADKLDEIKQCIEKSEDPCGCLSEGDLAYSEPLRKYTNASFHITAIADPMTDMIYRFVHTPENDSGVWMDRIIEFNTTIPTSTPCTTINNNIEVATKEAAVIVDIYKVATESSAELTKECEEGNSIVTVNKNIFQIRHGMLVTAKFIGDVVIQESDQIYVTGVNILNSTEAELTLSHRVEGDVPIGTQLFLEADRVLNFSTDRYITGINVLDGMIFWTDNYSEPKKVNIERSKLGSVVKRNVVGLEYGLQNFDQHTKLICNEYNPLDVIKVLPSICS